MFSLIGQISTLNNGDLREESSILDFSLHDASGIKVRKRKISGALFVAAATAHASGKYLASATFAGAAIRRAAVSVPLSVGKSATLCFDNHKSSTVTDENTGVPDYPLSLCVEVF